MNAMLIKYPVHFGNNDDQKIITLYLLRHWLTFAHTRNTTFDSSWWW